MPSLKHPKWIKTKQVAQLCLTPHLVATSWLSLKFVGLFHVSMFLWILKIHVAFDVLCSCIYYKKKILKKKIQKNSRFLNLSQKRENFEMKKSLWTRGIEPLGHFLKKKFFELEALDFLVTFSKRPIFFLSKISRFFKVFFSKWYMRIPWIKLFLNCGV